MRICLRYRRRVLTAGHQTHRILMMRRRDRLPAFRARPCPQPAPPRMVAAPTRRADYRPEAVAPIRTADYRPEAVAPIRTADYRPEAAAPIRTADRLRQAADIAMEI